jgi:hypothetical protein
MVWDFDKTLIPAYSQTPIFEHYGIDAAEFWDEVNNLVAHYESRGLLVGKDTAYLNHILTYVAAGILDGLTNSKLREFGARIEMSPGMPEYLPTVQEAIESDTRYQAHELRLEHYVVSTGIRHLVEGSPIGKYVKSIWANEFIDHPPQPGYLKGDRPIDLQEEGVISQVGYMVDNTSKTRAIFEINKGPEVDVNALVPEDQRRIPIRNMIYVADGPSDVPVFSVVMKNGGRCLGVYQNPDNFPGVKQLEDEGRVHSIAQADFRDGTQARLWLDHTVREIANRICLDRERYFQAVKAPAGHVV